MLRRTALALPAAFAANPRRIPIAFLGGAHSHAFAKAKICQESPDWDLRGVVEPGAATAERFAKAGIPLISREAALAKEIRAIAVESDVKDHFEQSLAALQAGKHLHAEKPPADTMAGMKKLVGVAKSKNLLLQSGYMWRYHPGVTKMIEAARSGWLGDLYLIQGQIHTLIANDRRPGLGIFKGGQMFELGSHLIDAVVRCLGRPDRVTPFLNQQGVIQDNLKDNTAAVFEYARTMAIITSAALQPNATPHRSLVFMGTNGTATLRPIEGPQPKLVFDLSKAAGPYAAGTQDVSLPRYTRYVDDLAEFAAAIRGEKKLSVDLATEVLVHETLLRASAMA